MTWSWKLAPIFSGILLYLHTNGHHKSFERFRYKDPALNDTYDFIIVGAGSAGSVLANRLAHIKDWSILLVEAGGEETPISETPLLAPSLWHTDKDWNYTTVRQDFACLEFDGYCQYPRGRGLGGSSSISLMYHVRGNKMDYDNWEAQGNELWSYKDVLPYFLKSENMTIPGLRDSPFHSTSGRLTIEGLRYSSPLREYYVAAAKKMGFRENFDYNGETQNGITTPQLDCSNGTRCSASRAFLTPIKRFKNIHIAKRTFVENIILSHNNRVATGVRLTKENGKTTDVAVKKEIILCAGAINTPKILMLSGIGPKDHLTELGIKPRVDLPVGQNLVDHTVISTFFKINKSITITRSMISSVGEIEKYNRNKTGSLASSFGVTAMAHFSLNKSGTPDVPDFQCCFGDFYSYYSEVPIIQVVFAKLRPMSVGSVRLRSSDPYEMPLIDPKYFSNKVDFTDSVNACMIILDIMASDVWAHLEPKLFSHNDYCKDKVGQDYCKCVVKLYSKTMFHPTGTARMASNRKNGVVTPGLKVWGISNLRVIDASVIPNITSGNINAATIMIGEKGADIIKNRWIKN